MADIDVPEVVSKDESSSLSFSINPWILIVILGCIAILWYFFGSKIYNRFRPAPPPPVVELENEDVDYDEGEEDLDDEEVALATLLGQNGGGVPLSSLLELLAAQAEAQTLSRNPRAESKIEEVEGSEESDESSDGGGGGDGDGETQSDVDDKKSVVDDNEGVSEPPKIPIGRKKGSKPSKAKPPKTPKTQTPIKPE